MPPPDAHRARRGRSRTARDPLSAVARWAATVRPEDVPTDVLDRCRAQRRSILAAIAAGRDDPAAERIVEVVRATGGPGPAPLVGTDHRMRVEDAVQAAAVCSVALDDDDYAAFAHPGHSAVLVPLLLAAETGSDGTAQIVAQVVANEVACRFGGVALLGPQNGQLWTFVHAVGGAVAAGRLLGLDTDRMRHALALALSQAPRAVAPALAGPDSKLLLAAEPAVVGLRAARFAAAGVSGPPDVLAHSEGFWSAFATAPLHGMLTGLGRGWATRTLSIKAVPGCAYVSAAIEALHVLGPPPADEVAQVVVEAALPTLLMDALSAPAVRRRQPPTPVAVTFSTAWSLAVAIEAGWHGPQVLRPAWLDAHAERLAALAGRVQVRHDPALTAATAAAFATVVPPRRLLREAGLRGLRDARRGAMGAAGASLARDAGRTVLRLLRHPPDGVAREWWDGVTRPVGDGPPGFSMVLPARVQVTTVDGRRHTAEVAIPEGGAAHPQRPPEAVARRKLQADGPALWGEPGTAALDAAIERDTPDLAELFGR